jgi:RNA polymerase sigma-70 factor (ECF subfamily)
MTITYDVSSNGALGTVPFGTVPDELDLVRFSQNGDRDAFACLYEANLDRIHRYIFYRVYDQQVTEDITSLVFLKVWENLGKFKGGQVPFAKWLYRIAHNTVIDYYRTRKPTVALEDVHPLQLSHFDRVDDKIDINILSQKLMAAMDVLTSTQREVLTLRFIVGLTTMEIAKKLKKGQGAVRALQMRGLRRLAQEPAIHTQRMCR